MNFISLKEAEKHGKTSKVGHFAKIVNGEKPLIAQKLLKQKLNESFA